MRALRNVSGLVAALATLIVMGLACSGSKTAPPSAYVGTWTGGDGTYIAIRGDGSGDYRSGSSNVTGGSVTIDESAKTLKITFVSMGPSYTIDKAPSGDQMTLSGVVFRKSGGDSDSTASDKKPEVPADDKLQTLVKTTFMDFSDAVQDADFTDFHKKIAKVWRDQTTPDELKDSFKAFIADKKDYDFKKAVSPLDATFTPAPEIGKVSDLDALIVKGYYPTKPMRANFELKYIMDEGAWKLVGINIKTKAQ